MTQFHPESFKLQEDRLIIPNIIINGEPISIDFSHFLDYFKRFIRQLNNTFNRLESVVGSNEASALIIIEGESLPTAERHYNGRLAMTEKSGGSGEDELHWCKWNGSAWAWEKII